MKKLLVNAPTGVQELIEIGPGGGYFDSSRVLWDERTDGPMPEVTPGALVRSGNALAVDPALAAARTQKLADAATNALLLSELLSDIQVLEEPTGFTRKQREYLIANSPAGPLKAALGAVDVAIAAKRALLKLP